MAKKRRERTDEEEINFKMPKFNEEEFLKKERRNIKTLFLSFLFGFIISVISFGFWILLEESSFRGALILLLGIFNASWLRYLFFRLNIDLTDFGRKGWFGSYATYFFTWLIMLIILINPPFYDNEAPHIEVVALPGMQESGGTVNIVAHIVDNVGIKKQGISFTLSYPDGTNHSPDFTFENNIFSCVYENTDNIMGNYSFKIKATDINGHTTNANGFFEYNNSALEITSSRFSDIRSGDSIIINANKKISNENFRVYYRINNGSEINVNRKDKDNKEKYETTAEFEGWKENTNLAVKVYAEAIHYFENLNQEFSNIVEDTTNYNFSTGNDSNIGSEPVLLAYNCSLAATKQSQESNTINYSLPCPRKVSVPGFELLLFIVSLVIVVLIFKYRRKDRRIKT